ncbi:MAG: hypothetical protein H6590_06420 [Flavobacteriales bacterium]|nr:hypothetical protein [Flavobacteriales bacterium]
MPNPLLALLLLLTACAQAQHGVQVYQPSLLYDVPIIFENPEDSAEFARFREGMQLEEQPVGTGDNGTAKYRLVWEDRLQGGLRLVTRGDDEMMKDPAIDITGFGPFHSPFRTADGKRGVMVTHEWPCALVCVVTSYYVEE